MDDIQGQSRLQAAELQFLISVTGKQNEMKFKMMTIKIKSEGMEKPCTMPRQMMD
jgi:hypothetical protein